MKRPGVVVAGKSDRGAEGGDSRAGADSRAGDAPAARIGEAAALYELAPSTLRWWERQGVISPSGRGDSRRQYRELELRRIGLAYLCRVVGRMPLDSVAVVTSAECGTQSWQRKVRLQVAELDAQIERMTFARDYLADLLRCPADDPARCAHLDAELVRRTPRGRFRDVGLIAAARAAASGRLPAAPDEPDPAGPGTPEPGGGARCAYCDRAVPRVPLGRPRTYCTRACQQRAYRARARAAESARSGESGESGERPR
ncbi:MerR family transcriptional regulator [Parafrankia sp. FMc2]|uniref:MerR family transcriptional regulator n=1 Tax=Parafrankia sp. FMc2 TaxID=3233196 RepID=UPI0034D4F73A